MFWRHLSQQHVTKHVTKQQHARDLGTNSSNATLRTIYSIKIRVLFYVMILASVQYWNHLTAIIPMIPPL